MIQAYEHAARRLLAGFALAMPLPVAAQASTTPIFPVVVNNSPDPLLSNLTVSPNAPSQGMWSTTYAWPLDGLHLSVMPDGRVVSYGTPLGQGVQDGRTIDIWDPALGMVPSSHLDIANGQLVDSFCSAAQIVPSTGNVLVSGGGSSGDGYTSYASTLVTPQASTAVNSGSQFTEQRWYGSMITLADGRQLMMGGSTPYTIVNAYETPDDTTGISITPEVYSPARGWSSLLGAYSLDAFGPANNHAWYPRAWVAPDGKVFGISMEKMWVLDPVADTITTVGTFKTTVNNTTLPNVGPTSTAVMYDTGRILQVGGNGYNNGYPSPSSPYASVFDISGKRGPVVTDTAPMTYPRQWANSLVMPDGRVLVTGGSTYADNAGSNAVYAAEIWTPSTGQWTIGASAGNYRGYHSSTALLPDGVVLSTGGGVPGPVTNLNAELYYPPYLFATNGGQAVLAPRPEIVSLTSTSASYGGTISIQMLTEKPVKDAALIGLSATTHSFNMFQRRIDLKQSKKGAIVTLSMPANANLAPPGYYLLTVLNGAGVPSAGVIIALNAAPVPTQPSVTAILPVDGVARSIGSSIAPGYVVRHYDFVGYMDLITPQNNPMLDREDASFFNRAGLANPSCYSFESLDYPGYFLRSLNDEAVLNQNDGSSQFAMDSTFCAVAGLSGVGFSLQSIENPQRYLHNETPDMFIDLNDGSQSFAQNASFFPAQEFLPADGKLHAFANLTQSGALIQNQNFEAFVASVNAASDATDIANASFYVLPGNASSSCYSFESSVYPNYFLRHQNFVLWLQQNDGSSQFAMDSTFCLQAGLAGLGFSLTAINYPTYYLRQSNYAIFLNANDGSGQFETDATFTVVPAP